MIYRVEYPNGKIYVGMNLTGTLTYFGSVDSRLRLQMDRLEALHAALWPQAKLGHVPSVRGVLSVMQQQLRLLGIDPSQHRKRPEDDWPSCVGPATVVLHPDDCRHKGCDRHGAFER